MKSKLLLLTSLLVLTGCDSPKQIDTNNILATTIYNGMQDYICEKYKDCGSIVIYTSTFNIELKYKHVATTNLFENHDITYADYYLASLKYSACDLHDDHYLYVGFYFNDIDIVTEYAKIDFDTIYEHK